MVFFVCTQVQTWTYITYITAGGQCLFILMKTLKLLKGRSIRLDTLPFLDLLVVCHMIGALIRKVLVLSLPLKRRMMQASGLRPLVADQWLL